MVEDHTASMVNLAKATLMSLDQNALNTTLPTATIKLLCHTLVDLGSRGNQTAQAVQNTHLGFVQSKMG